MEPDHLEDVQGARCLPKAQNLQQSTLSCLSKKFTGLKTGALTLMTHACHLRLYLLCDLATLRIGCALCNKMILNKISSALPALYYSHASVETSGPVIACLPPSQVWHLVHCPLPPGNTQKILQMYSNMTVHGIPRLAAVLHRCDMC